MLSQIRRRCCLTIGSVAIVFLTPALVLAQRAIEPLDLQPARIEASVGVWTPHTEVTGAAEGSKIPGTTIDYRRDLGLSDHPIAALGLTLRPAARHKIRLQFLPIEYTTDAQPLTFDVVFKGVRYGAGSAVNSAMTWKAVRIGYEYDIIARPRYFVGVLVDVDRTNVKLRLRSASADEIASSSVATIPAIGGVVRVAPTHRITLGAELTGLKVPDKPNQEYGGHFADLEAGGTVRVTRHLGAQLGVRSIDIRHLGKSDSGTLRMTGAFVQAVLGY